MRLIQWVFICSLLLTTSCTTFKDSSQKDPSIHGTKSVHQSQSLAPLGLTKSLSYSENVFKAVPFIEHNETKPFKSYVAINLNHEAYVKIRKELQKQITEKLQGRDESHITVITPPEYDQVLKKRIGIRELQALAKKRSLQLAPFKLLCIGKSSQQIDKTSESTYYVVVTSESLFNFRKEVQKLFVSRGGRALDFNPDLYYPHVTLGFTKRDLHLEDGVMKSASTCAFHLKEVN